MITSFFFNQRKNYLAALLTMLVLSLTSVSPLNAEMLDTRLGKLEYQSGYPTARTAQELYDELDFQRAVQAYLWALPMASYGAMADTHRALGTDDHTVIVANNSAEQQQLLLTANQDTIYTSGVLDLSDGPMEDDFYRRCRCC